MTGATHVREQDTEQVHEQRLEQVLDERVSTLLERSPEALDCLIRHGFTPLRNPVMRAALTPTVTLAQAIRLRGLSTEERAALLTELAEVLACR